MAEIETTDSCTSHTVIVEEEHEKGIGHENTNNQEMRQEERGRKTRLRIDLNNRFDLHFIESDKLRMVGVINQNIGQIKKEDRFIIEDIRNSIPHRWN